MIHDVIAVQSETPVREIAEILVRNRISALPVLDHKGRLIGWVSERDLLRRAEIGTEPLRSRWSSMLHPMSAASEYTRSHGRSAKHVMNPSPSTVREEMPLAELATVLEREQVSSLPVVRADQLVGIVSRADVVRALARVTDAVVADTVSDDVVEEQVQARIKAMPGGSRQIHVTVRNGVATLSGLVGSRPEREVLIVIAENTPGVHGVQDQLFQRPQGGY